MVSFIDCHLSLRRCSPFNGGKFEGWGTSFCWWPNRIGYLDELSEQAAKLFFDPKEGLGLNIIRYNIGGGDDPTHHHITRTDSMVPGYAINPSHDANGYHWSYDWNADQNQRNVTVFPTKPEGRLTASPSAAVRPVRPISCTQIAFCKPLARPSSMHGASTGSAK